MIKITNKKRKCNPEHEQVLIEGKHVDKTIAPLLKLIWKHGIETTNSCGNNHPAKKFRELKGMKKTGGYVWIEFLSMRHLTKFLNLVAKYPSKNEYQGSMYQRIIGYSNEESNWKYNLNIHDWGVKEILLDDTIIPKFTGKHDIDFVCDVRFDKKEIFEIMKALK